MSRRPTGVEIDVNLSEVAAGRERRAIPAPVGIRPCAVLVGRSETWVPTQPGVPTASSGVDSARVAASVCVSGCLTRDVAIVPVRQIEPAICILFEAIE